jgi:formylglycine-generating enzyme required for sulfatase activity
MALVEADYCPHLVHNCLEQLKEGVGCCKVFAERNWCFGKPERRRFCIDRFEYPNLEGVKPAVMVSWDEARGACETEGKRLCLESEWNLACEGGERLPYPYGRVRDSEACNIDRPRPKPEPRSKSDVFVNPRKVGAEVARLDQRVESGARPRCASPFGVHDMTGNVDEWVVNEAHFGPTYEVGKAPPVVSGLKGGYWGPIRARCRPMTTGHDRPFRYYQTGFRCCANAPEGPDGVADAFFEKMTRWRRAAQ